MASLTFLKQFQGFKTKSLDLAYFGNYLATITISDMVPDVECVVTYTLTVLISCDVTFVMSFHQVKTQLENPTRYFIAQKQKRQLKEYLKTQGSPSAAGDLAVAVSSANQPTLNAINQQAVAALASSHLMGQPESPMAVMSPDGNQQSDVSTRLLISYIQRLCLRLYNVYCK